MRRDSAIAWYRTPIDKDKLRDLTRRSDIRPLGHVLSQILLATVTGTIAYLSWKFLAWPTTVLAIWVHATVYAFFGYAGGGHELSHRNVFRTRVLNEIFMVLYDFLSWGNFVFFRHSHAKHHQLTVHHGLDMEVELPHIVRPSVWFWAATVNLPGLMKVIARRFRWAVGKLDGEWERKLFGDTNSQGRRLLFWWARLQLLGHTGLAVVFVTTGQWILLFLITFAPFIAQWLAHLAGMPQHIGLKPDVTDYRICCRTYVAGRVVAFLYWNMNYHVEHHMYASVPFYNLPKLRKEIEWDLPPAARGLGAVWRELRAVIRRQRLDPDYVSVPALPESANPTPLVSTGVHEANAHNGPSRVGKDETRS